MVNDERSARLKELAMELEDIILTDRQLCDLELLATGVFSPLEGFMTRLDFEPVLHRMRLQNGRLWPIPVCLNIPGHRVQRFDVGQSAALRDQEGFLLAVLHIEDIWKMDWEKESQAIYGTLDQDHPGVNYLGQSRDEHYYIGGRLEVISLPLHFDSKQLRMTPEEIKKVYQKLGWRKVIGFQSRNPIHRPQFEMTIQAMREAGANLLILPVSGMTKPGDFDHYTRVRCLQAMAHHYPADSYLLNLLPLAMRMAGPRDAILDMIISKNFGCTHFIIGHDYANPGLDSNDEPYYTSDLTKKTAAEHAPEIGIHIIQFQEMVYLPFQDQFMSKDLCPANAQTISLTGTDIRNHIFTGRNVPEWATFPEVLNELQKAYPPQCKQGFTIFLTGLSGAGKSTIAKVLYSRFLERGGRPVTLLDGDIVRQYLSSELNFSKEHRDINVRRIGYVASEITKNRGIAICAPIAPYAETRREIRAQIEIHGGFIEVHVATPLGICEQRDRKGMYAKARAGMIKGYTGIDDPYEEPVSPEVAIDTTDISPNEAAREVLLVLSQKGFI